MKNALILFGFFIGAGHALLYALGTGFEGTVVFLLFALICIAAGATLNNVNARAGGETAAPSTGDPPVVAREGGGGRGA